MPPGNFSLCLRALPKNARAIPGPFPNPAGLPYRIRIGLTSPPVVTGVTSYLEPAAGRFKIHGDQYSTGYAQSKHISTNRALFGTELFLRDRPRWHKGQGPEVPYSRPFPLPNTLLSVTGNVDGVSSNNSSKVTFEICVDNKRKANHGAYNMDAMLSSTGFGAKRARRDPMLSSPSPAGPSSFLL
ncbi:hypothetical protein MKEN_00087200 [Mycena kentingensis (nom. inval.)]|nr:hypothetical protein MKEN_00087200 [Mycena kentingensis (nom. inval.)]